ncbi:TetR/AcrR family transcriptional regulator [Phycicoccus duodecadis]|uniref:TetR family transcriptional regulator n=1 Tax=Phycicoccus duodecadis TaxID=173053 RepID=A0A2N3YMM5_9MICO|nr:TetR/AcrR family transcriptional regulator [Phycicoccus duodecadis]PKW28110.1 TetR family transcriptional regulator [Phycicoccus duodecadis]
MSRPVKTRLYRSPARAERAAATRSAILDAAAALFAGSGFAGTTVAAVARTAGVSVDTVYASVGRKPELLLAVHDRALAGGRDGTASRDRDYVAWIRAAASTAEKLELYAEALADRLPHSVPLAEALRDAASHDPACRAVWEGLEGRRRAGMLAMAADLRAGGGLRGDLDDEEVAQRLWMTNAPEYYRLATAGGRGPQDYAAHLRDVWARTLLA